MRYNLANKPELDQAWEYLQKLTGQEAIVEIKKVNPNRSLKQNSYYHLILGIFGLEFGWTVEEAKILHKREVSPQIFIYDKKGKKFVRSSADLTTKEMTDAIEQLRKYSADNGLYLPSPGEDEMIRHYENIIEKESLI